jgi:hypothetical protein
MSGGVDWPDGAVCAAAAPATSKLARAAKGIDLEGLMLDPALPGLEDYAAEP